MDPTKNLAAALEHARLIVAVSEDPDDHPEANNVCVDDTSLSLARTLLDLDEWITNGGSLPAQWVGGNLSQRDHLIDALSPDEASDLMIALSEVIDRHGKMPEDDDEREQVHRWQALSERIDRAGDWEVAD